jgi:hypothetical protein
MPKLGDHEPRVSLGASTVQIAAILETTHTRQRLTVPEVGLPKG